MFTCIDRYPYKNNLDSTPLCSEAQEVLNKICKEYKNIFSLHQGDGGHTKLVTMDIDTGDHSPVTQKPDMLPLKHTQWV